MSAPRLTGAQLFAVASKPKNRLPTTCAAVDQALDGGFDYGQITSIAGPNQADRTVVTLYAVANHLISSPNTDVAYIYTTEAGVPVQLHDILIDILSTNGPEGQSDGDLGDAASELLNRVKLMRVFDFIGVLESVGEVSEAWSLVEREKLERSQKSKRREEIPNSQDEDLEVSDEDESDAAGGSEDEAELLSRGFGMIVVDNIANVLGTEISKDQTGGHSLLTSFFRTLLHLTRRYKICTVLINTSVVAPPRHDRGPRRMESVSMFSSIPGKPGSGQIYAHLIDVSLFISDVPKTRVDAERAYASAKGQQPRFQTAKVIEVLGDRTGYREGRWGSFEVDDGVALVSYG